MKKKVMPWIFLSLHVLCLGVIIGECALNAAASSSQSGWAASFLAKIINILTPGRNVTTVKPNSLTLTEDTSLIEEGKLIQGKSKLVSYSLSYPKKANSIQDYSIKYQYIEGTSSDFALSINQRNDGGSIYITPYKLGEYSFLIETSSSIKQTFSFQTVERSYNDSFILGNDLDEYHINIGESISLKPTWERDDFVIPSYSDEDENHYLARIYDISKIPADKKVMDNPSIALINEYGVITGLAKGESEFTYGPYRKRLIVDDASIIPSPTSLTIESNHNKIHYDEYSSWLNNRRGIEINVAFPEGDTVNNSVHFYSEDPLIAMVSVDKDNPKKAYIQGNQIRKIDGEFAKTKIWAISDANPEVKDFIEVDMEEVKAATGYFSLSGKLDDTNVSTKIDKTNYAPSAADKITLSASLLDEDGLDKVEDKRIEVISNNEEVAKVLSSPSNKVTINFLKKGNAKISFHSISNPDIKGEITFDVARAKAVGSADMPRFHFGVRKTGHFLFFTAAAIFGCLFLLTLFGYDKSIFMMPLSILHGGLFAFISELIQKSVPGRVMSYIDVGIDMAGYAIGILFTMLVALIVISIIRFNKKEKNIT